MSLQTHDIGDQNVERLLSTAYRPEALDAGFVQETRDKLRSVAKELAAARRQIIPITAPVPDHTHLRRRLGWAMGLAAAFACVYLVHRASQHQLNRSPIQRPETLARSPGGSKLKGSTSTARTAVGLTPRPRSEVPAVVSVKIGDTVTTKAGEKRRVMLEDGSVLFINEDSQLRQVASRRIELTRGEIYVEVSPLESRSEATFLVATPDRKVSALGTRFSVRADAKGSGVLVTQGKVQVSDLDRPLTTGEQLLTGSTSIVPAPRATHRLDWTKDLMAAAESPLVPGAKHGGGALLAIDPFGQEIRLTLRKFHVDVHIEDGFARTTIDQTYFNNESWRLEGTFYFPLPPDASLSRLAMYVEDGDSSKLNEGGMAERNHAREVYETIRHQQRDPALLEWVDGSTFKMRVFPLEGRKEKRIVLSYTQRLTSLYGTTRYRFPTGHTMELVSDWSFHGRVKHGAELRITSPSHPDDMTIAPQIGDMVLDASAKNAKPEKDVIIEILDRADDRELARFNTSVHEKHQYLMLRYRPELKTEAKLLRRDWVILFEAGANRDPLLARTQIEVLKHVLENAEHDDTFTLLTANTRVHFFDNKPRPLTVKNVDEALAWLDATHLIGALDLNQALEAAGPALKAAKNAHLLHVGAGVPALGERDDDVLVKLIPDGTRYVGIGVGKKWNRAFMKMAAERSGGFFTQINPDEPIAWKAFDLLATLNTPRLMDLRVVDANEKAVFLSESLALAQGEEVCAIARIDAGKDEMPTKVIVSGKLDGRAFTRTLDVVKAQPGADYLPRTWAKLEIDRLLADGAQKNKATITKLSMSSYVMSPFTSLLVLETDEDYRKFNVDRGRKDHWAMYPCPDRIPTVFEPDLARQAWLLPPDGTGKQSKEQVLSTILLRSTPQFLHIPGLLERKDHPVWITALRLYQGAFAAEEPSFDDFFATTWQESNEKRKTGRIDLGLEFEALGELTAQFEFGFRMLKEDSLSQLRLGESNEFLERLADRSPVKLRMRLRTDLLRQSVFRGARTESEGLDKAMKSLRFDSDEDRFRMLAGLSPLSSGGSKIAMPFEPAIDLSDELLDFKAEKRLEDLAAFDGGVSTFFARIPRPFFSSLNGRMAGGRSANRFWKGRGTVRETDWRFVEGFDLPFGAMERPDGLLPLGELDLWHEEKKARKALTLVDYFAARTTGTSRGQHLIFSRPRFEQDQRLFGDLTLYAPGLQTWRADIAAALEREAKSETPVVMGNIDEAARKLFDRARSVSWQTITIDSGHDFPFQVTFNGLGHFQYERILSTGLREEVIGNGEHLYHLYREIGLAGRRPNGRHYFNEISDLVPWLLPPVEEVARTADVKLVKENVVALVPRLTGKTSKDAKRHQLYLVFEKDQLVERRLVEVPSGRVLARVSYGADGTVRKVGEGERVLSERKLGRVQASAPSLTPDTDHLLVVRFPVRTAHHLYVSMKTTRSEAAKMGKALAEDLFVAHCWGNDGGQALGIFAERFHSQGDRRLGFYALLNACRVTITPGHSYTFHNGLRTVFDVVKEHPENPLARYLDHNQMMMPNPSPAPYLGTVAGGKESFLNRLGRYRDLVAMWSQGQVGAPDTEGFKVNGARTIRALKDCNEPLWAWAVLEHVQQRASSVEFQLALGDVLRDLGEQAGLSYAARYQQASSLQSAGKWEESKKRFLSLHEDAFKEGFVPPIDGTFRTVLNHDAPEGALPFAQFLRERHERLLKEHRPLAALSLAWQTHQMGEQALASEFFLSTVNSVLEEDRNLIRLAGLEYLWHTGQFAYADTVLSKVLQDSVIGERPFVWRVAAQLAGRRGMLAKAVTATEKAMDLEYQDLPAIINLEAVRNDYRALLSQYQQMAMAFTLAETEAPKDLVAKVIKSADRWRSLDPDNMEVPENAARVLQLLGAKELAWDYLTTPIGMKPGEAEPWVRLAGSLKEEAQFELADRAYIAAYQVEPTNAEILWQRAQNYQAMGRMNQARVVFAQIADGTWQPRFRGIQEQAKGLR